jgi:hypothetical protein
MGLHSRVPVIIWVCLGIITLLSMATVGYQAGQAGKWVLFPKIMLALAFATVIALIADLDRPQTGLVKVSQGALERQRDMMREEPSQQQPPPTTTTEPE